jgi:hypothetical protein
MQIERIPKNSIVRHSREEDDVKGTKLFFLGVVLAILVFSTFWAGNVYAATGCFLDTNGHWAETFICWMKDNGITGGTGGGTTAPTAMSPVVRWLSLCNGWLKYRPARVTSTSMQD